MSGIKNSEERGLDDTALLIYGASKGGKTTLSATASKYYPEEELLGKEKIFLKDLLYVTYDDGGLDGFLSLKLSAPQIVFKEVLNSKNPDDKRGGKHTVITAQKEVMRQVREHCEANPNTVCIYDTVSMFNFYLKEHYSTLEGWDYWGAIERQMQRLYLGATSIPGQVIFLSHSQTEVSAIENDASKKALTKNKKTANQLAGGGSISVDLSPQKAKNVFRNNTSLFGYLRVTIDPKTKQQTRMLVTESDGLVEAGNRFHGLLDPLEEPHLGRLLKKARGE